jgi:hypothetical protein
MVPDSVVAPPDVSVIVPVYNALPYLTECMTSLVGQSIGPTRMEIIAVDDGSTDGSGKELDDFDSRHPGLFKVLHQANSGGPAGPCNRGLEVATGRYVYFLGADDYLWREALKRLVAEADEYGSDVVAGRMVGVNDRYVHQAVFARTDHDVQLFASELPWSMSNAKLFRRALVEQHGLRFPEDLPMGSDQAFTLEACVHAHRISVLADDTYYFAVRRTDSSNITYRTKAEVSLACTAELMHRAAKLIEAGSDRDAILGRHFAWELVKVLTVGFLELDESAQHDLCRGVAELADAYLTEAIFDGLVVRRRLPLCLAQTGKLDILREVIREQSEAQAPGLFLEGGRAYLRYAGFREEDSVDDRCYEVLGEKVTRQLTGGLETTVVGWSRSLGSPRLDVAFSLPVTGPEALEPALLRLRVRPVDNPAKPTADTRSPSTAAADHGPPPSLEPADDGVGTIVRARLAIGPLLTRGGGRWTVLVRLAVAGTQYELPLPLEKLAARTAWHGTRAFSLLLKSTKGGKLQLVVEPVARRSAVRQQLSQLVAHVRGK